MGKVVLFAFLGANFRIKPAFNKDPVQACHLASKYILLSLCVGEQGMAS